VFLINILAIGCVQILPAVLVLHNTYLLWEGGSAGISAGDRRAKKGPVNL
jgi:hypothetical protein